MRLSDYLKKRKLTMTEFAAQIDRAVSTVSRIINGHTKPDWDTVSAIQRETDGAVKANDFMDTK